MVAVLTGPWQFSRRLRQRSLGFHRVLGRVYLIAVVCGSLASFRLAFTTTFGWAFSREEQTRRFKARLDTPEERWKVEESDFADRKLWPKFQSACEEILTRTSTSAAPWYVIPADHKWFRDVAVAGIVLAALKKMHPRIPVPTLDRKLFNL